MSRIRLGIESIIDSPPLWLKKGRVGLLVNQASVDGRLVHTVDRLMGLYPGSLKLLLSPQHGIWGEKQANMVASKDVRHPCWDLSVYSLYGPRTRPSNEIFDQIDILMIDLQDVGCRIYTFAATLKYCLEEAQKRGKKVVVADRPNPIGGVVVEGNLLDPSLKSLIGPSPIPIRHGMTLGELAIFFNRHDGIGCDLEVIPMKGWQREMIYPQTGLTWVPPSPNMPFFQTALVYPGQVLLEGTNLSEGRGTTQPFEIFGAPYVKPFELQKTISKRKLPGIFLREVFFEPQFDEWKESSCGGFHLHVIDQKVFKPYFTTLAIIQDIMLTYPEAFRWKDPPYEYEHKRMPIDLLTGSDRIRIALERGEDLRELEASWLAELERFKEIRSEYLIYDE